MGGFTQFPDNSYFSLCEATFALIETVAKQEPKYTQIVRMENYHHYFRTVSCCDIKSLSTLVADAFTHYEASQKEYVQWIVACQFPTLFEFFTGLERLLQHMRDEDIQFQTNYTKQKMQKVVQRDTSVDFVKKAAEAMWKRVQKHLCKEEGLHEFVWEEIAGYLAERFTYFEGLLTRCYSNERFQIDSQQIHDLFRATSGTQ
eukprot:TRINITY_DN10441_c0_g1::TRINITY_DN10441_c0_g1_i1::g.15350::m.15350 TRINITY_DN10441_c0_g1::TRINITY_DN10441_c0_g1_i1::g.15350  ORF type:complete len:202 (+),score=58.32,sp/Q9NV70/EXOC1_HUMAN/33.72/6e-24,Sec3_C/PF09763.4/1.3e-30 TRINITY_DN10441_c0_g1_i1:17-622(+)